jgi:hypothetical protein
VVRELPEDLQRKQDAFNLSRRSENKVDNGIAASSKMLNAAIPDARTGPYTLANIDVDVVRHVVILQQPPVAPLGSALNVR